MASAKRTRGGSEPLLGAGDGAQQSEDGRLVITELRLENFKRISAVRLHPETGVVQISGPNGAGKSSVLDGIAAALCGKEAAPEMPVRRGHDRSEIELVLADHLAPKYRVVRTFTRNGTALKITTKEGVAVSSPQTLLDDLIGDLSFDPMEFVRLKPKERVEVVRRTLGINDRLDAIEKKKDDAYARRTEAKRALDRAEAVLASVAEPPADTPDQETSVAESVAELNALNDRVTKARAWLAANNKEIADARASVTACAEALEKARRALADAEARLQNAEQEAADYADEAEKLIAAYDPSALERRIAAVESINAAVRAKRARKEKVAERDAARRLWQDLNHEVENCDFEKIGVVTGSKIPVVGMELRDNDVTLSGVPFEQASFAQQLAASVQLALAVNQRVRVVLVREGSMMDSDTLVLLAQIAEAHDAQVFVERVADRGAGVGIVIEDGAVREEGGDA